MNANTNLTVVGIDIAKNVFNCIGLIHPQEK